MNKEILNNIYHAFRQYGVEKEQLSHYAHFQDDLKLSDDTLEEIFESIQKKVGIPLNAQYSVAPGTVCELEEYLVSSIN